MKFFIIAVLVTAVAIAIAQLLSVRENSVKQTQPSTTQQPLRSPSPVQSISVSYRGNEYVLYYSNISNKNIAIISNFSDQKSALAISKENNCAVASNGGFYTENDKPLGLFKVDGKVVSPEKTVTSLINGYLYIDAEYNPHISRSYPDNAPSIIQSGPFYSSNSVISTVNDKPARRVVIAETATGAYYLLAITAKGLTTSGPLLSDIGAILFSITDPFKIASAVNLDGGAASYYRGSDGYELNELTHVGSVICVTDQS